MANALSTEKQTAIIGALAEGSSIRSIERLTGVHRDTIMRLGVRIGNGCAALLDSKIRGLTCRHLQIDELWGIIGKKERHMQPEDNPTLGDVWTFCAIDSDTKPVKETFQGHTVWEGIVEIFDLKGHPKASRVYAWAHKTEPHNVMREAIVLHISPIDSPLAAVKAAIVQEYRDSEAEA